MRSDQSGVVVEPPTKSMSGVSPPRDANGWRDAQVDHKVAKSKGGTNSNSNAAVLSRGENRDKWDK